MKIHHQTFAAAVVKFKFLIIWKQNARNEKQKINEGFSDEVTPFDWMK